jgi:ketosteroid isomerase-like protein
MTEVDSFLAATMPRLREADDALHNGDAAPRAALWSHRDPVTLFGAALNATGWTEIGPVFERLASSFSNLKSSEIELVAAGASGDLAYTAAIEHTIVSINAAPPAPYTLRVTTVYRREDGEWKVVHRHGDPLGTDSGDRVRQLTTSTGPQT